jgi:hypothetical protein
MSGESPKHYDESKRTSENPDDVHEGGMEDFCPENTRKKKNYK